MFANAKWIWPCADFDKNQHAYFYFEADIDTVPASVRLDIACETKYFLFVNGKMVVFDGGLFRESRPGCGYWESVELAPHLTIGKNEITIDVSYYGNGGRNNKTCAKPGLLLSCKALSLFSNAHTLCEINNAYVAPAEHERTFLYGGGHTAYDANIRPFSLCPSKSPNAHPATVLGDYADAPWGELYERPIPFFFFTEQIACTPEQRDGKQIVKLPYAMHFTPYFRIKARAGDTVVIHSDRYCTNGGPGDWYRQYYGHRIEYTCRDGEQEFEMRDWIFGEEMICTFSNGVEILSLGYRESGYPTEITATLQTDNPQVDMLFQKCARTLKACMRENFMDCPDRERGQWIGDIAVQAPQVPYLLDQNGLLLLRKAILDFIHLRRGDVLVGNVPGDNSSELPSQSLNAIGEYGILASFYATTGDAELLRLAFEPAVNYLKLWETDADGVVTCRHGNWEWYDHLYNCDKNLLTVCWYYSALRFAKKMATVLNNPTHEAFLQARMQAIETHFEARYWKERGNYFYYASGEFADDRANALAVLSGLCPAEKYQHVRRVLLSVFNSTPYMENYVLMALCEMGYQKDAFRRMMCRYQPLIEAPNSTLWEDFFHLGTRNHAWSGGPSTILMRYFVGVNADLTVQKTDISPLRFLHCTFTNRQGETVTIKRENP